MAQPYIKLTNICKKFGTVQANKNVCLEVDKGEILALLGENGSGKSTLVNMLSGIYTPDSGRIEIAGKGVVFHSPKDAIKAGIGMIHQHFKLVDVLTAAENIVIGQEKSVFVNRKKTAERIKALSDKFGISIDPDKKIYNMSVSEKQTVEIMKILYRGADVLILDEPTAVLTPQEIKGLFAILREMKAQGCCIIIITHKLAEVMEISDRVTVLRKGESITTAVTKDSTPQQLTEMMVGSAVSLDIECPKEKLSEKPVLSVDGLIKRSPDGVPVLNGMTFDVYGGEILGVAGIAGSGQKELCEIVAGLMKADGGSVKFEGKEILGLSPREILRHGVSMSFIPEDRLGMGLVAGMSVMNNVILKSYNRNPGPFLDRKFAKTLAAQIVRDFDISTPSVYHEVKKLSGGNIQKVLLGREIWLSPRVLITAYPVRGLDIGASYNIYHVLNEQKKKGVAVLFIGEDLDVLKSISDRLMVIHDGAVVDIADPGSVTKEDIGMMMLGHKPGEEADRAV
ncbi:MAG: ABC transporter ATP-binding protein [Oscillospiraceae bacterium]|nr:ABC transporter ATP-binding protein [Oscillospiraceae bacterium]